MPRTIYRIFGRFFASKNIKKTYYALWGIVVGLLFLQAVGIFVLRRYDVFYRTVPVINFDHLGYRFTQVVPKDFEQFTAKTPQEIMAKIMNFVDQKHNGICRSYNLTDLYFHACNGGGLNCNGMAELFVYALFMNGFKARKIFAVKNMGMQQNTHTLVEVWQEGRWIVYDPTFNVSFKKEGQLLSACEIACAVTKNTWQEITPLFYGEVAYKARLEAYPVYWLAHFNNVLLFDPGVFSGNCFMQFISIPLRYWWGPIFYYFSQSGEENQYLIVLNKLYCLIICIIPFLLFLLFLSLWWLKKRVDINFNNLK